MAKQGRTFSLFEASSIIGVTRQTLAKWLADGCPAVTRADRSRGVDWEISIAEVMDWRIRKAVDDAVARYEGDAGKISREEADRRTAVARMITSEIEADEALGKVVAVADVADAVTQEYGPLRTQLQSVGAKVAGRAATMTSAPAIQELVDAAIVESLEALKYDRRLGEAQPAQEG